MGIVARRQRGDHICRLFFADDLAPVNAKVRVPKLLFPSCHFVWAQHERLLSKPTDDICRLPSRRTQSRHSHVWYPDDFACDCFAAELVASDGVRYSGQCSDAAGHTRAKWLDPARRGNRIGYPRCNYPTSIDLCSDREPCQLYWRLAYRRRFIRYRLGLVQIVGHVRFEHRKPALLDNPMHLLIGPMFMIAKLFVALGFRPDLARALQRD